jgi:CheY-like chemotaxis protein
MAQILVADDDEPTRIALRHILEADGHAVATAEDGAEALDLLLADPGIDLLVTDIAMPLMDGIALALAAARERPELPIVLMTGFADQRDRAGGLDGLVCAVVAKPFTRAEIAVVVRSALMGGR